MIELAREGFAPFCLVYCFVVIQLYHKIERISSFSIIFFLAWCFFDLWITLGAQYTETQGQLILTEKTEESQSHEERPDCKNAPVPGEALQNFGEKNMLTRIRTTNMRQIFEEILTLNIVPNGSPRFPLELTAEYAEEADALEIRLRWAGPEYNPLTRGDELTLKLGRAAVTDSQFTYEAGVNLLVVTL